MGARNIAVVGAGIFGVTTAVRLSHAAHRVTLFEQKNDILGCASLCNQYRLHRGYHYPRSPETAEACVKGTEQFKAAYPECVVENIRQHYCIVGDGRSKINGEQFLAFCDTLGLRYRHVSLDILHMEKFDVCVEVDETVFDWDVLRRLCKQALAESTVRMRLGRRFTREMFDDFDLVVVATYARSNELLAGLPRAQRDYQFEVCEKLILQLPPTFARNGVVIMDGPFMCIDARGFSNQHLMGNVVHAIHKTLVGKVPQVPPEYRRVLDNGITVAPKITNFEKFIESAREFYRLDPVEHVGSMYTIRTVLPDTDDTDERPTIVSRASDRIISVFSGKIPTCIAAADEIAEMVQ